MSVDLHDLIASNTRDIIGPNLDSPHFLRSSPPTNSRRFVLSPLEKKRVYAHTRAQKIFLNRIVDGGKDGKGSEGCMGSEGSEGKQSSS